MIAALLLSGSLALTFDDIPGAAVPARDRCDAVALGRWNAKLLTVLRRHHAPALGLVVSGRTCSKEYLPAIFEQWLAEGHELGNHTAHHLDANTTMQSRYEADIIEGENPLRALLERRRKPLVWFRYPMLHTGPTLAYREGVAQFLAARGYRDAVVTIDSDEYLYNNAYAEALDRGDQTRANRIASAYIPFMESVTAFFEKRTKEVLGHAIPHVLLLHMSALNADHLDELLMMFEHRGYSFITIEEAMRDSAYALPDGYSGRKGLSWIHRWGLAKGIRRELDVRCDAHAQ